MAGKRSSYNCVTIVCSLVIVGFLSSCSHRGILQPEPQPVGVSLSEAGENNAAIDRHAMLKAVMVLMSTPYRFQGDNDSGMDCSGFTSMIFSNVVQYALPHSVRDQFELGRAVPSGELKFGDLVFFELEGDGPSHVGIYVGDGLFAHASVSRGVTISLLGNSYYRDHYIGARRILP